MKHTIEIVLTFDVDIWDGQYETIPQKLIDQMLKEVEEERNNLVKEAKGYLLSELL